MKSNRRNFLKTAAFAGAGAVAGSMMQGCAPKEPESNMAEVLAAVKKTHSQKFNMSGYSAPPLPVVRVGLIGLGDRGSGAVQRLSRIEGVEITALADKREVAVKGSQRYLESIGRPAAREFFGSEDEWKKMAELPDLDLIYICTPWVLHTPNAVYAMEHGKHAVCEVPIARTIDECWQLVETSEKTKKHCMMLENCCYDFFELLTLNMARQGMFGDLIHGEGAYIHNLLEGNFLKVDETTPTSRGYTDMWRLRENATRNGNLYPTHGLGPICQILNINRGDRMDYLSSVSTDDFSMGPKEKEKVAADPFYEEWRNAEFRGNINTTIIRTALGKTMMVQHDVSSEQPYSRIHLVKGTKGMAVKYPRQLIALGERWLNEEEMANISAEHTPEIIKRVGEMARQVGGHGGMDFIMDWRMIDCLRNGLPLDQDVYDGAAWSAVGPLSEWSVANRSQSIEVPDFTGGSWKTNKPHGINLETGGTTGIIEAKRKAESLQMNV
ncbi:MAG TPA: Gfo/Idh/MocA family oxidoreductase [Bacteroidales bacterium]|nr:Gfo/Idh/MocA family oxidoreductase [Bacteroidales bacterium]HPF03793.1 Gfo/Idh/MocA family oxidoreductase [Bacteroidales bacterium]HPJ59635.1 Gfo/Idh/MocA family oxidoreductase [Bacteroidales bacterium]HPR10948.1 Gfo/Idh/MocA family oxidoreductase [Bacteroidales bacterium]HRW85819.1 Gfo/Idh/MocA family oxidoreductase [Bacteroidales bacterium]